MKDDELLKISEAAKILHLHPRTVLKMIESGRLMGVPMGGKIRTTYRILRSELERFFDEAYQKHHEKFSKDQ